MKTNNMFKIVLIFGVCVAMLSFGLLADVCAAPESSEKAMIKIGFINDFTGAQSGIGRDGKDAALVALDEINAAGGLNGHRITFVFSDDSGDPAKAASEGLRLIADEKVLCILGPVGSGTVMAAAGVAAANKCPVFATGGTADPICDPKSNWFYWTFSWFMPASDGAKALADKAYKQGYKKIGVSHVAAAYGLSGLQGIKARCAELGMEVVLAEGNPLGEKNLTPQALKFKQANIDCIISWDYAVGSAYFVKALREAGCDTSFWGGWGNAQDDFIVTGGKAKIGSVVMDVIDPTRPEINKLWDKIAKRTGYRRANYIGPSHYDSVYCVFNALKRANLSLKPNELAADRAKLRQAIEATSFFSSLTYGGGKPGFSFSPKKHWGGEPELNVFYKYLAEKEPGMRGPGF